MSETPNSRITLDQLMDRSPWTLAQKSVLFLVCLGLILDGFDNYVLALAIPSIAAEWGVQRGAFGLILALGLGGLCLGTVVAGWLGDKFGRKTILIISVATFGVCTLAAGWADNLTQLAVLRILAGLGMGGAVPNATTLIAEITPTNRRSVAVTIAAVSIAGGGIIGGGIGAYVLPEWGWRGLFIIAGVLPLPVCLLLIFLAPESHSFTGPSAGWAWSRRPKAWPRRTPPPQRREAGCWTFSPQTCGATPSHFGAPSSAA